MCGIVGYIGERDAFPILIGGLKRLEYRGYDSAGVAMLQAHSLRIYKAKGKVADLEAKVANQDLSGHAGIAHTRWATHGGPSEVNAHPHLSQNGRIALVHNGIIENYAVLKEWLMSQGCTFKTETDSEVIVQQIAFLQQKYNWDTLTAIRFTLKKVEGAYALAIIDKEDPGVIYAARKSSPLAIGLGENEFFLGSDASPIVAYTKQIVYLNDFEIAIMKPNEELKVVSLDNEDQEVIAHEIDLDISQLEKQGYDHFMMKEIMEQPEALEQCMRGRIRADKKAVIMQVLEDYKDQFLKARHITIIACGTSWHAALIGKQLIDQFCRIPVMVEYASEFRYSNPIIEKGDVVMAISQSGETADTLAAIQLSKEKGAFVFGICNAVSSSIARATDAGCYIHVGPEIGVASTKAFTGQVMVLTLMALKLGRLHETLSQTLYEEIITELTSIPYKIREILKLNDRIEQMMSVYTYANNCIYLGRGFSYPVALEGALKLKEISYIHAEGYPAAEMKHGPIALISENMPVICLAPTSEIYDKVLSNIQEIKARNGRVLAIVNTGDKRLHAVADSVIEIPATHECLSPLLSVIPLQLMAYHIAVKKGLNVDMPRNLAKSVTVE